MDQEKFNSLSKSDHKNLPIGAGREFFDKRKEIELPVAEIKNFVSWVNPAFKEVPFKLIEGQPTKLGLFFTAGNSEKKLSIAPEHRTGRSGMVDPVIFRDAEGRLYRDVDLKGIGAFRRHESTNEYSDDTFMVAPPEILSDNQYANRDTYEIGIVNRGYAINDRERAEELLRNNIRTYRIIAFIDLEEIIDKEGNKVSIEEAKNQKLMRKDTKPIIEVRAFTTRERVDYVSMRSKLNKERKRFALEDARLLVAQELGKELVAFPIAEYIEWFSETLGIQLARLRKLGLCHGYLHSQNITLDCKIVDLDSLHENQEENEFLHDFNSAWQTLNELFPADQNIDDAYHYLDLFKKSYENELSKKPFQESNFQKFKNLFRTVAQR